MLNPALAEQGYYGEALESPEARGIYHDAKAEKAVFGPDGMTFDAVLDTINPLHHIPIVSSIYGQLTGDKIAPGPSVVGGLLFGGVIGAAGSVANAAFEAITGDSIGGHAMAMLGEDDDAEPPAGDVTVGKVQLADAAASAPQDGASPGDQILNQAPPALPAAAAGAEGTRLAAAASQASPQAAQAAAARDAATAAVPQAATQTASLAVHNMFRAKNAMPAAGGEMPAAPVPARVQAQAQATPQAMDMNAHAAAAMAAQGLQPAGQAPVAKAPVAQVPVAKAPVAQAPAARAPAGEMPQLSADLDARLRHAQKALAASGLVAAPDAAMQARLDSALSQIDPAAAASAAAGSQVPPPPSAAAAGRPVAQNSAPQAAAQHASQGRAQAEPQVQQASFQPPARPGSHSYMPLDADGRGGRRWYGLGTADVVASPAPASPQMAAQALANEVYRQRGAAAQAAAGSLDVTY